MLSNRSHQQQYAADLSHIGLQGPDQRVLGPMQDDEALLLFALARTTQVARILEVGGLHGFSAANFMAALRRKQNATFYTLDVDPQAEQGSQHRVITKDAMNFMPSDIDYNPIDLLFLDCHARKASQHLLHTLLKHNLLRADGYVVLHDTGLHPLPLLPSSVKLPHAELWVHQPVERQLATWLQTADPSWQRISLHDDTRKPFRHGLTIMQRRVDLSVPRRTSATASGFTRSRSAG